MLKTLMLLNQYYFNSSVRHIISLNAEPNYKELSQAHDARASTPLASAFLPFHLKLAVF